MSVTINAALLSIIMRLLSILTSPTIISGEKLDDEKICNLAKRIYQGGVYTTAEQRILD